MQMRRKQGGFIKIAYIVGTLGFIIFIGMKIQPVYLNEMKLARAVKSVAAEANASAEPTSIKKALQKWWNVEDIALIQPAEVRIVTGEGGKVLAYDYWNQVEIFQGVFLSFNFAKEFPVGGAP